MNFKYITHVILLFSLTLTGCEKRPSAADSEVSKLEEDAVSKAQVLLPQVAQLAEAVSAKPQYRKVLLSEIYPPMLTLVNASGTAEAFYIKKSTFTKEDGASVPSDLADQLADLVAFLRNNRISGFIVPGVDEAFVFYINPNLTLHYLGGESEAVHKEYALRAAKKYDYRNDFTIKLSDQVFVCSERR